MAFNALAAPSPDASAGTTTLLRDGGRPLLGLLVLALMLKAVAAAMAISHDPLTTDLTSDSRFYWDRAAGLAGLWDDPLAGEAHHLPPLYPWVLRCVPGALTGHLLPLLLLQALAGTGVVAGTFVLARRRASRRAALIAAALVLLYAPLTFFESRVLGDSLATALVVALLVVADRLAAAATARGRWWLAALLGALASTAALARPQALLLVPLLAAWLAMPPAARRPGGRWPALALLVAAALVLTPSAAHNRSASGDLILVSDNGGVNLWLAATGPVSGTFDTLAPEFGAIEHQARQARSVAEDLAGRRLSAGEVSRVLARQALAVTLADPASAARRVGLRARALTESFETGVVTVPEVEMRLIPVLRLLPLPFGLLLGLFAASWALGALRGLSSRAPCAPMIAVGATVVVATLAFYHYSRFRLPLVPLLAVGAAVAADAWPRSAGRPARRALAGLLALLVTTLSFMPAPHHDKVVAAGWTNLAESRLRQALDARRPAAQRARAEEALADAGRALAALSGYGRAELAAAHAALLLGRWDEVLPRLARIEHALPGWPPALLVHAELLATADPANPFADAAAAAEVLARLRAMPLGPGARARVAAIERKVRAAAPSGAREGG